MRKLLLLSALLSFAGAMPAEAAKFTKTETLKSRTAQEFLAITKKLAKNKDLVGDASFVTAYNIARDEDEKSINTIKQLNIAKGGIFAEEEDAAKFVSSNDSDKVIEMMFSYLIGNFQDEDQEIAFKAEMKKLSPSLQAVLEHNNFNIYAATHSNEDGTWNILNVLDEKNNQVIMVVFGAHGT